ncbi:MAG: FAD-dependent oxidoreductase, partial [Candidatus Omnitrophica bacterium]|nr:FAD-dependent oxidoreductase [Candidatus Omnitrophota bacterium]
LYAAMGTKVTLVEKLSRLLPGEDPQVSAFLEKSFRKQGIAVHTGADVGGFDPADYRLTLVAVGRRPFSDGLGLEKCGVSTEKGRVVVDDYLATGIKGIWAAGDCTGKIMLAHYAAYQGKLAVANIAAEPAQRKASDDRAVPNAVFTFPEVASVGRRTGTTYTFDLLGSGMARVLDETEGFVKIVTQGATGEVIGASLVGPRAAELVAVLGVAVQSRLTVDALRATIFAHPTLSEALSDALHS